MRSVSAGVGGHRSQQMLILVFSHKFKPRTHPSLSGRSWESRSFRLRRSSQAPQDPRPSAHLFLLPSSLDLFSLSFLDFFFKRLTGSSGKKSSKPSRPPSSGEQSRRTLLPLWRFTQEQSESRGRWIANLLCYPTVPGQGHHPSLLPLKAHPVSLHLVPCPNPSESSPAPGPCHTTLLLWAFPPVICKIR